MEKPHSISVRTILLVDDEDASRITTKWFLTNFGYLVEAAASAEEALKIFNPQVHDVVVTDNAMPGMSGAEMAHVVKLRSPSTRVIMCSSSAPAEHAGVDLFLKRPTHLLGLKDAIEQVLVAAVRSEKSSAHQ